MAVLRSFQKQLIGAGVIAVASFAASYAAAGTVLIDGYAEVPTANVGDGPVAYPSFTDTDLTGGSAVVEVDGTSSIGSSVNPDLSGAALSTGRSGPAKFVFTYSFDAIDFSLVEKFTLVLDAEAGKIVDDDFTVVLIDDAGLMGTITESHIGGDTLLSFFLTGFSFDGGFNIAAVEGIVLTVDTSTADDIVIDTFQAVLVPSPTAAGFGALGLVAFALRRRK